MPSVEDARRHTDGPFGQLIETTVRVMTWNVWWRFGPWPARQPAIAATLRRVSPDIVGLQEVWTDGAAEQAAILADAMGGYHHAGGSRLDFDGVQFGNAVLSRWPIRRHEVHPLPSVEGADERRCIVFAEIDGPRGPIQVFTTHLNWRFDHSAIRVEQVRALCELVAATRPRSFPPVLLGDFNADPGSDEVRLLTGRSAGPVPGLVFHDAWELAGGDGPGHTWCNDNPFAVADLEPDRRIDHVLVGWPKAGGAGNPVRAWVEPGEPVDGVWPSDHRAMVADLRY